jgi:hypothetical protein
MIPSQGIIERRSRNLQDSPVMSIRAGTRFRQYPVVTFLSGAGHKRENPGQVRTDSAGSGHILMHDRTLQETNPMQKSSIMMLIASLILIAGILIAGCTDSSSSVQTSSTLSAIPTQAHGTEAATAGDTGAKPQFNESAGPNGMQMNSTQPSGTPPDGMQMNGTHPSGGPQGDMNGTQPSGTPPDGMQMGGSGPSGTPPSGTPSSGS